MKNRPPDAGEPTDTPDDNFIAHQVPRWSLVSRFFRSSNVAIIEPVQNLAQEENQEPQPEAPQGKMRRSRRKKNIKDMGGLKFSPGS